MAEALLNKGNIHGKLGRSDEAIATYDKALSLNPALADARIGRANIFRTVKRFDEAVADYETALKLNPGLAGAWLGRGNVSYDQKRYDEALAAYDKALALKPDLTEAWLGRGNVLQHLQQSAPPGFFEQGPAVRQERRLDLVPFRYRIGAVPGFSQNEPMLALFDRTVPFGVFHFSPDFVGWVLSDFENGRKKGEFGRWILHKLSRGRYGSQQA